MSNCEKVKVLHIIARLNIGGPAIYVTILMNELPKNRFKSQLITGSLSRNEGDMSYLISEKGMNPFFIPELGREISFVDDLKVLRKIVRIFKKFKPDIIHTHTAKAGAVGRLSAILYNLGKNRKKKIKLIHTFHGHVFHSYFGFLKTYAFILVERILGKFTDRIIVVSSLQREDICRKFKIAPQHKVVTIPYGIDLKPFSHYDKSLRDKARNDLFQIKSPATILVGIVGRLTPVKNHYLFIDMAKTYREFRGNDQIKFIIVGDGELRRDLEKYAVKNRVENDVIFAGWHRDMPSVYHAFDIVTLTSKNEGSPFTLIEAMASKKPVLATDVGGVRNLFGPVKKTHSDGFRLAPNGILVASGDSLSLAKALRFLVLNPEISGDMARKAQDFVLNVYSKERLIKDIDNLYSQLVRCK